MEEASNDESNFLCCLLNNKKIPTGKCCKNFKTNHNKSQHLPVGIFLLLSRKQKKLLFDPRKSKKIHNRIIKDPSLKRLGIP